MDIGSGELSRVVRASLRVERAMGIEPTGKAQPELENKWFHANADAKCDQRVNFHVMRGNAGLRETTTPFAFQSPFAP